MANAMQDLRLPSQPQGITPPPDRYQVYLLVTEADVYKQLVQGCYLKAERLGIEPVTFQSQVQRPNHYTTMPRDII